MRRRTTHRPGRCGPTFPSRGPRPGPETAGSRVTSTWRTCASCETPPTLIVIGYRGGSLGAGQEFGWASALRIPILYLRPKGDPLSRQIEGTPADTEFAEFESIEELKAAVVAFVRSRRTAIEDHPRRLRDRPMMLPPFAKAIEEESNEEIYRELVQERGWSPDRYEAWMGRTLKQQLLARAGR